MARKYSDIELIEAVRNGNDNEALKYIYKTVLPKVKAYILTNSGDKDEALDVFQDAVMKFYRYVMEDKFDKKYEIAGFIYSVSRNLWINRVKQKSRTTSMGEADVQISDDHGLMDDIITAERENLVRELLGQIGERCKELLIYSVFYKYSMKEICERMGFATENGAKTRNYKCKQKLINLVKDSPTLQKSLSL